MQKTRPKRNSAVEGGTGKVFARRAARLRVLEKLIPALESGATK